MDCAKTGLMRRLWALAAAVLLVAGACFPAAAQTTLFQEPEITVVAGEGNIDRVKELIQQRTHLDRQDSKGRTALVTGTIAGQFDIVDALLAGGARTDVDDKLGNTALNWASSQGDRDIADMLIKAGSDLNHQNRQGLTPLMLAAAKSHLELVELLIRAGADVNIQDYTGRSALGWARGGRDRRVEFALEDAGGRD